ncbi:alpha-glucosidase-like [Diprion similis]|uniref:alpha-glucosidase-like n=1 Tax=Diprion similis TaxID=362088 RepID=UPI001EF96E84|nr:alpha-glucosidase-like [Diprion similis]
MCSLRGIFFVVAVTASIEATSFNVTQATLWWQTTTLYQIWPRSFKDSDGDGIGDLNGITSKLTHLVDMGIEVIWLSPFFASPLIDSGYDISDYLSVNPVYGTLDDFDDLIATANELGLKVVLDYVPNHTSDEHAWFNYSKYSVDPYTDYYIWNEGIEVNGTRNPPNNWLSVFNSGSAWEWVDERQAYYLHQFHVKQPDLNFTNELVIEETKEILTFWLDRGIYGFRIDSLPYLIEDASLADEPASGLDGYTSTDYYYLEHIYTKDLQENYEIVQIWRDHIDNYTLVKGDGVERVMFTEAYANISSIMEYYNYGSHVPFNFFMIKDENGVNNAVLDTAGEVVDIIVKWMENLPENATANWVFGNHDNSRIATKLGEARVDAVNLLLFLLPGVATIYNGDEIGMTDTYLTWEETEDPQACSTDESRYESFSRDPERTPYQWDNTTSAGFSTNATTMLPVNSNYLTLNLAAQKAADISNYKNVQELIRLRNSTVVQRGNLNVQVISESVIAFTREIVDSQPIAVLVNWDNTSAVTFSLEVFESLPETLEVLIADINSGIIVGDQYAKTSIELPANAAVVLQGVEDAVSEAWTSRSSITRCVLGLICILQLTCNHLPILFT